MYKSMIQHVSGWFGLRDEMAIHGPIEIDFFWRNMIKLLYLHKHSEKSI